MLTTKSFLLGDSHTEAGGAIVLRQGEKFFLIRVEMDLQLESAFEAEMISLLIAIDIVRDREVTIFSDCKSALSLLNGKHRGAFLNILSGWRRPLNAVLEKVRAHPERFKELKEWKAADKGIWMADQVAGGSLTTEKTLKASSWIRRVSYSSKAVIVRKETGMPFFRDVAKMWSKHLLKTYLIQRDEFRARNGKTEIWKGANIAHSYRMMSKRRGLADRAAVQRAALDKRWRWHWAREDKTCSACGSVSSGIIHPLRYCKNESVIEERGRWRNEVEAYLRTVPTKHRALLENIWACMEREEHGEYACCGIFLMDFVSKLDAADKALSKKGKGKIKTVTRVIGRGAWEVLRVHTDQNVISRGVELDSFLSNPSSTSPRWT